MKTYKVSVDGNSVFGPTTDLAQAEEVMMSHVATDIIDGVLEGKPSRNICIETGFRAQD